MLKKVVRPEFLNRIDEIIMFSPLNEGQIKEIVKIQLNQVTKMLSGNGIQLEVSDNALSFLAEEGYDPQFGARPVKRAIQRYVLNDLSKAILKGEVNNEKPIIVDYANGKILFRN
jgi:ATP-dependent Clp protease ATP-binding subunit ClpB